jgi:hypothetical protein
MPIQHIVLIEFTAAATPAAIADLSHEFATLPQKIPGIVAFEAGENVSPEGLARGFTHAFVLTFADAAARDAYLPHPQHQAFVGRLQPVLQNVLVFDYALA